MQRSSTPGSRRITWSPGWRLRAVLLATAVGSVCGLVFGLSSPNRPLLNAAVFYVLGAVVAALVTALVVVAVRGRRRVRSKSDRGRVAASRDPRSRV
jgi:hypothetical protein